MKRKRQKSKKVSELIRKEFVDFLAAWGYNAHPALEPDWSNICDCVANDIIAMLDDMEDDEEE